MRLSTEDGVHSARKPLPSRPFHRLPIDSRLQVRHHCLVSVSIFCFSFLSFFFFNFVPFHRSEGIKSKIILSDRKCAWNATPNRRWKGIWDKRQWKKYDRMTIRFDDATILFWKVKKKKKRKESLRTTEKFLLRIRIIFIRIILSLRYSNARVRIII